MKKAVTCAQCGTKMRAGIKFCSKCGYLLKDAEAEALAAAAQAEEAAANFLTEEEVAAIRAESSSPVPAVADAPASVPSPEEEKLRAVTEGELARQKTRADVRVARVEGKSALRRQTAEDNTRVDAARRDKTMAEAEVAAAKRASGVEKKMTSLRIAEDKKAAKRLAEDRRKNFRATAAIEERDAARAARTEKQEIEGRAHATRMADRQQAGDLALVKKQAKESMRSQKEELAEREAAFRVETKGVRARTKALRAEDRKTAKYRRDEENAVVREKVAENRLYERRVAGEKAKLKQRATADARMQSLKIGDELKQARRLSAEREKATRVLLREEGRAADRGTDEIKRSAEEKAFDNRLYAKQAAAEKKTRRRRQADVQRVAAKQAAVRERETKRLGAIEYKAAAQNLTAEAAEARRQADLADREMQRKREEEKLNVREAAAEKRLIRQRASDLQKNSRTKTALRVKATRALGRAELRALRVTQSEEAKETRRKTDEVKLHIEQKTQEDKLYAKKLAAERRLIRTKASDNDKLQRAEIQNQQMMQEAQMLEDSRATRIRTDDTKRAVRTQKKEDELYQRKKTAEDKISEREHKLELKRVRAVSARDARIMAQKEKEQRKNLQLADRYERDAVRRAKKISKISGVPVSLVPALSGEGTPAALLTAGGTTEVGTSLQNPEALLASSYETNREQYIAYRKKKKSEAKRLRYVEIGVRNDRKYFNAIYENGEIMVAKRTVRVARIQAILAIALMLAALFACFLPILNLERSATVAPEIYDIILDGQGVVSFETLLTDGHTDFTSIPDYLRGVLDKFLSGDIVATVKNGIESYITAFNTAMQEDSFLNNLGNWIAFGFLALAVLLTPFLIFINLVVAILRLVFRFLGKGVGITRVMKNLRASYALLGFMILPVFVLAKVEMGVGLYVFAGSFFAAVLFHFILNLLKKHEPCDRKYLVVVRLGGLVRFALLAVFFVLVQMSGIFAVPNCGSDRTIMLVSYACLGIAYILLAFCARAFTTLGFEVIGYTKGQTVTHIPLVVVGVIAMMLAYVPKLLDATTAIEDMAIVAALVMLVVLAVTAVLGMAKRIIIKRNNLIDPILDALDEGYPLK